jgi:hypothetical protein
MSNSFAVHSGPADNDAVAVIGGDQSLQVLEVR